MKCYKKVGKIEYDAVIVGSGPNGLSAAIVLQQAGLSVLVLEAKDTIGGGLRSAELTLPGFLHDVCSAIHPLAANSPFFNKLPLGQYGLDYVYPEVCVVHPFDDGNAAVLRGSVEDTASNLGIDRESYIKLLSPLVRSWPDIAPDVLAPLHFPKYPIDMAAFGLNALKSASWLSRKFKAMEARWLWGGMAAHSIQPLSNLATSAIGLVLMAAGHLRGWPVPIGGGKSNSKCSLILLSLFGRDNSHGCPCPLDERYSVIPSNSL